MKKNLVVLGNGPSVRDIDYTRLPEEYDVFRCNQFYLEDKYYLGSHVTTYFMTSPMILPQYYTMYLLQKNKEYSIDKIVVSTFGNPCVDGAHYPKLRSYFRDIFDGYELYISQHHYLDSYLRGEELFSNRRITSGIYMCIAGVIEKYENIYIAGIDFYKDKKANYAFDHRTENLTTLIPEFNNQKSRFEFHSESYDKEILEILMGDIDTNFYSLSSSCGLIDLIHMAPVLHKEPSVHPKEKSQNYISDIQIPPNSIYDKIDTLSLMLKVKRKILKKLKA